MALLPSTSGRKSEIVHSFFPNHPSFPLSFHLYPHQESEMKCRKVCCYRSGVVQDSSLLECNAVSLIKHFPTFRKSVVCCCSEPSSPTLLRARTLKLLDSEDEGISILLIVENYSLSDRTPHAKRLDSIRLYLRHRKNGEFPLHWSHKENTHHCSVTCTTDAGF
jgi:hypothetical protein